MKNKKTVVIVIAIGILCMIAFAVKPVVEVFWVSFMDFTNPQYYEMKLKEWSNKPTEFLIEKLGHPASAWNGVAGNLLAGRKDIAKEDQLIKIIESNSNTKKRSSALGVLFAWDDEKAKEMSMRVLESGKAHPLYDSALGKLAYRKYDPAYPYVVELAKAADRYANGSVSLLEKFGRLESLPILEEMLKNTSDSLYRTMITRAIQSIKEKNGVPK